MNKEHRENSTKDENSPRKQMQAQQNSVLAHEEFLDFLPNLARRENSENCHVSIASLRIRHVAKQLRCEAGSFVSKKWEAPVPETENLREQ